MTFRSRLLVAFATAAVLPLALLALGVRRQLTTRLRGQYQAAAQAQLRVAQQDLSRESASIAGRLSSVVQALADDDRFRLAVLRGLPAERPYLLDYAGSAMRATGLSMLQLQDETGRILSSGHFRNEFDRLDPALPRLLSRAAQGALVRARTPEGAFVALARTDSLRVGGRRFDLVGGVIVDADFLRRFARDDGVAVALVTPDSQPAASMRTDSALREVAELVLPFVSATDSTTVSTARLIITQPTVGLLALQRDVTTGLAASLILVLVGAVGFAAWLSARLSHPLAALAVSTDHMDLDGSGTGPDGAKARERAGAIARRDDEIGTLARQLGSMGARLRSSAARLREAERRATVGDMARQVNHDIKNGLIPIRNVLRHLGEVQQQHPEGLADIFAERRPTLDSSVEYLDRLARTYARLTPRVDVAPVDINAVVRELARSMDHSGVITVETRIAERLPVLYTDPVIVRRILDNLVRNAVESLEGRAGRVTVTTARTPAGGIRIVVADTGPGMTADVLSRAFDDFFTTRPGGTGLGLSVVRRLTSDLQGVLTVESEPGRGTVVTIELPVNPSHNAAPNAQA